MKTFELKYLNVILNESDEIIDHEFPLLDGLIINREDESNRWVIEALIEKKHWSFFEKLKESNEDVIVQVKITTETNEPASLITNILGLNELAEEMNVLFMGTIIDEQKNKIEKVLKDLIDEGYSGDQLLNKFKTMF